MEPASRPALTRTTTELGSVRTTDRTTVSVATGAWGPVREKLNAFLGWSIHCDSQIVSIQSDLGSLQSHLLSTWEREDLSAKAKERMDEARELSYDMEDDIDDLVLAAELGGGSRNLQGLQDLLSDLKDGVEGWREGWEEVAAAAAAAVTTTTTAPASEAAAEDVKLRPIHIDDDASSSSSELVVGMDGPKDDLVKLLQEHQVVCIHGFAGTGKTTLAHAVYREIGNEFECRAFVSVSKSPNLLKVLQAILSQVTSSKDGEQPSGSRGAGAPTQESTINDISNYLSNKRYMIIVDDVWDWKEWEVIRMALPMGRPKCGIIITTRVSAIAVKCCHIEDGASTYRHDGIVYEDAVTLSSTVLKKNAPTLSVMSAEVIGMLAPKIAEMCYGMPLAVSCLSSAVAKQSWRPRHDDDYADEIQKQLWQVLLHGFHRRSSSSSNNNHPSLKPLADCLRLGYQDLHLHEKTCLLYCSIYPIGYKKIERHGLMRKWVAEGFVYHQEEANACLGDLVHGGHLQPELAPGGEDKYYSVHPMMRAFLISKSEEANFVTISHDDYHCCPPLYAGPSHGHRSGGGTDGAETNRPTMSTTVEPHVETLRVFASHAAEIAAALGVKEDPQPQTFRRGKLERTHRFGRERPAPDPFQGTTARPNRQRRSPLDPFPASLMRLNPRQTPPDPFLASTERPIHRQPPSSFIPPPRRARRQARPLPIRRLSVGYERWMDMDLARTRSIVIFPSPRQTEHINDYWCLVPPDKLKRLRVLCLEAYGISLSNIDLMDLCSSSSLLWLRYLGLRGMPITHLPQQVVGLPSLETLDLSHTGVSELPSEIQKLLCLESLDLSHTSVSELPNEIQKLWRLESLDLSNTSIRELPGEIGKLQHLKTLNVSSTDVRELPGEIRKLQNVKTLNVSNTNVRELPREIGEMEHLSTLNLSNTSVRELPGEIGKLQHLKTLNVSNTRVRELPGEIGKLQHLKILNVSNTRVRELPREIGELKHLDTLDISYTMVRDLKPWLFLSSAAYILVGHKAVKLPEPVLAVLRQKDTLGKLTNNGLSIMLYDHFGHPLPVARFKVHGIHNRVPEFVKEHLANDTYLDIRLRKLDDHDLDFLNKMPHLQHLTLRFDHLPMEHIALASVEFSRLESFCLDSRRGDNNSVPKWVRQYFAKVSSMDIRLRELHKDYLHFLSEMANLQHLTLRLEVLTTEAIDLPADAGFSKLQSLCVDSRRGHTHNRVLDLFKRHFVRVTLSSLDIRLYKLDKDGLDLLRAAMPSELKHLTLRFDQVLQRNPLVLTKDGFTKLKMLCLDCCLPMVTFQQGAMPELEHLEFKFYTAQALITEEPVGIRHLRSLRKVVFQSSLKYRSDAPGISSVINKVREEAKEHPNKITISINGVEELVIHEKEPRSTTSASGMISEENIVTGGSVGDSSGARMLETSLPFPYDNGSDDEKGSIIPVKSYYPFGVAKGIHQY